VTSLQRRVEKRNVVNYSHSYPILVTAHTATAELKVKRRSDPATRNRGVWGGGGRRRRKSSYSFLTLALDGGEWSASRPGRALPPGKGSPVPIGQEAGWAPEPIWTQRLEEKSSVGDRTPVVQSVFTHYTHWATAAQQQNYRLDTRRDTNDAHIEIINNGCKPTRPHSITTHKTTQCHDPQDHIRSQTSLTTVLPFPTRSSKCPLSQDDLATNILHVFISSILATCPERRNLLQSPF
jgi:hypothetical protein